MTNKEMKDRLDAIEDLVKRQDGESLIEAITRLTLPPDENQRAFDAEKRDLVESNEALAQCLKASEEENAALTSRLQAAEANIAHLTAQGAGATAGSHSPAPAGSTPAPATTGHPSEVPDTDPNDRRPAFHPELGWRTPEVVEWAARQRRKASNLQPAAE